MHATARHHPSKGAHSKTERVWRAVPVIGARRAYAFFTPEKHPDDNRKHPPDAGPPIVRARTRPRAPFPPRRAAPSFTAPASSRAGVMPSPESVALLGGATSPGAAEASLRETRDGESVKTAGRRRVVALVAGAACALFALVALLHAPAGGGGWSLAGALTGSGRAHLGAGSSAGSDDWLLGGSGDDDAFTERGSGSSRRDAAALGRHQTSGTSLASPAPGGSLRNRPGELPGLAAHVAKKTTTTKFRLVTFCNEAYWPFAHGMLQSMQFTAPSLIPFWTIVVADKETKAFVKKQAPTVDVFVDRDVSELVASDPDANAGELKKLLSWRRVHALHGLLQADFTAVFLEPDVVFTKNPLQLFHDMLLDADVVASADYGVGAEALERVNTKVLFAKPSEEAKKLVDVWQRAEAAYQGDDSERGFLTKQILPNADRMEAAIRVLDERSVSNYLSHANPEKRRGGGDDAARGPYMITGTGCDDVNYKLNFIDQIVRTVLPAGPEGAPAIDFEAVSEGCDYATRVEAQRGKRRKDRRAGGKGTLDAPGREVGGEASDARLAPRRRGHRERNAGSAF